MHLYQQRGSSVVKFRDSFGCSICSNITGTNNSALVNFIEKTQANKITGKIKPIVKLESTKGE